MTILVGNFRIGRNAEIRYVPSGEAVINLSLAYSYGRKSGDDQRPTQWIEAGLWGKAAEALGQHLTKGKTVFCTIEDVHIETFTKADQSQGHKLVGRIQRLEFVGPRESNDQGTAAPSTPRGAPPARSGPAKPAPSGFEDMDDDIPF